MVAPKINIRILIFIAVVVLNCTHSFSQESILDRKISIKADNLPLGKVLEQISDSGLVKFSYSNRHVPVERQISVNATNKKVSEVLEEILYGMDLKFLVVEEQIILKPVRKKDQQAGEEILHSYTITGYISDRLDGEILIGTTVAIKEPGIGTTTNAYGFYSVTLPEGNYNLAYSFVGYKTLYQQVVLNENLHMDHELAKDTSLLDEVVVSSNRDHDVIEDIQMSETQIKPESVRKMPALLGEVDVIKSLQSVPGIKFFGDGSTLFYVRGGNKDQNLILIDEAPIYNPAHFLGFFSILIPEMAKDIKVYRGDIPAAYGGRLSSLIDVKTRDGNQKRFGISGSTGFLATRLSLEGPFVKNRSSWFISGRRSQIGWLLKAANPDLQDLYFYDLNAKINFRINEKNRIFFSFYNGKDYFRVSEGQDNSSGLHWGNMAGTIRWNHLYGERLFSNTTIYASKYDYFLVSSFEQENYWNSHIANLSLKTDFSYYPNPRNTIRVGAEISGHNFNPGNYEFGDQSLYGFYPVVPRKNARGLAAYISNEQEITSRLSLRYGLRLPVWQNIGEATEYHYDENHNPVDTTFHPSGEIYNTFSGIEPRLGLAYKFNQATSLKASYSRLNQYIQLITNSISPFTSLEVWLPSGPNIKPQQADQVALGLFRILSRYKIDLGLEFYYKWMRNQIDYDYHAEMLLNPYIESELRYGKAWAYGFEFLLKRNEGKLTGWIGYSYSVARRKTEDLHGGKVFPAFYDRPHDLSVYMSYDITPRINIGTNWIYTSGAAITTPSGFYYYQGYTVPVYAEKNNDRLPDYHRLDLAAEFNLNRKPRRFNHNLRISLFNVYGKKNPVSLNFNKTQTGDDKLVVPGNLLEQELVASQMYIYKTIPSVTYHFRF